MNDGLKMMAREMSKSPLAELVQMEKVDLYQVGRAVRSIAVLVTEMADVVTMARLVTGKDDLKWVTGDGAGGGLYVRNGDREYLVYDWYGRVPAEQVVRRHEFVKGNLERTHSRPHLTVVYLVSYDDKGSYLRVSPNALMFASEITLQLGNTNLETMTQRATLLRCKQLPVNVDVAIDIAAVNVAKGA